jgi:hypothetical protein
MGLTAFPQTFTITQGKNNYFDHWQPSALILRDVAKYKSKQ